MQGAGAGSTGLTAEATAVPFLLVDWGTTSRRVYRIAGAHGNKLEGQGPGAAGTRDFAGEVSAIRNRHGALPMLLAGMAGSSVGWRTVPYVTAPATLPDIAGRLEEVERDTWIVPGVAWRSGRAGDVMRGEELQLLGAVAAGLVPANSTVCQPGTHCKWARLAGGALTTFQTTMTGELFAILCNHSLLSGQIAGAVTDSVAFRGGVREGARQDLTASLFRIRSEGLLGLRPLEDGASFASGLLIGADVQARLSVDLGDHVYIVADSALGKLYAAAIQELGGASTIVSCDAALIAGAAELWRLRQ